MRRTLAAVVILPCLAAPAFGAAPARIASLAPNITEILYDLGIPTGNKPQGSSAEVPLAPDDKHRNHAASFAVNIA
jgi:ABC-type Fe3+-hydroxamate transport system substrate-binding protein